MNNEGNREGAEAENTGEEGDMLIKEGGTQAEAWGLWRSPLPNTPFPFLLQPSPFPPLLLIHKALGRGHVTQIQPIMAAHPTWPQ